MTERYWRYRVYWGIVVLLSPMLLSACDLGPVPTPTSPPPTAPPPTILPTIPPLTLTAVPTAKPQPTKTAVPTPVPTATATATPVPTQPPAATKLAFKYAAPKLVAPPNNHGFAGEFRWEPLDLAPDEFYNVSVSYYHNKELRFWGGNSKTSLLIAQITWEKSDDNFYTWWVQVMRDTGKKDEFNNPIGVPVSPKSEIWRFYYEP